MRLLLITSLMHKYTNFDEFFRIKLQIYSWLFVYIHLDFISLKNLHKKPSVMRSVSSYENILLKPHSQALIIIDYKFLQAQSMYIYKIKNLGSFVCVRSSMLFRHHGKVLWNKLYKIRWKLSMHSIHVRAIQPLVVYLIDYINKFIFLQMQRERGNDVINAEEIFWLNAIRKL